MRDLMACADCRSYYTAKHDVLMSACASVGIEHGQRTGAILLDYLIGYHESGHDEDYAKRDAAHRATHRSGT